MKNQKKYCLNCENTLEVHQEYCSRCGQSREDGKLSVFALLRDSLTSFFNLDGRLMHTIRDLYKPSKLTRYYVAGRRKYYVNAGRLFLLSMIVLLALSRKLVVGDSLSHINDFITEPYNLAKQKQNWDSIVAKAPDSHKLVLQQYSDSMYRDINIDSLKLTKKMIGDINIMGFNLSSYNILVKDVIELSPQEVVDKYEIDGFVQSILVRQHVKFLKHPAETIWSAISQLVWIIFFLNLALAGFMKLIYIRGKHYYIEHFILSLYGHSFFFIVASLGISITLLFGTPGDGSLFPMMGTVTGILTTVVFFTSLLKYYQNGLAKTFIKWVMILIFYLFALIFSVSFGAVISFFIV